MKKKNEKKLNFFLIRIELKVNETILNPFHTIDKMTLVFSQEIEIKTQIKT